MGKLCNLFNLCQQFAIKNFLKANNIGIIFCALNFLRCESKCEKGKNKNIAKKGRHVHFSIKSKKFKKTKGHQHIWTHIMKDHVQTDLLHPLQSERVSIQLFLNMDDLRLYNITKKFPSSAIFCDESIRTVECERRQTSGRFCYSPHPPTNQAINNSMRSHHVLCQGKQDSDTACQYRTRSEKNGNTPHRKKNLIARNAAVKRASVSIETMDVQQIVLCDKMSLCYL